MPITIPPAAASEIRERLRQSRRKPKPREAMGSNMPTSTIVGPLDRS